MSFENAFGRSIDFWNLGSQNIHVGHTDQIMIGSNYTTGRVSFDIEAYYKKRYNLLEQALLDPRFDEANIVPQQISSENYQIFRGNGQTLGLDFLLSYTFPKYSGWISYTLSKSTINFEETEFDYGTVDQGEKVNHIYKFKNTGSEPLIISNAKGSCGCTVPSWPKEPIPVGGTGEIAVQFDSKGKKGNQSKRVTLTANTDPAQTFLTIKGVVNAPEGEAPAMK